MDFSKIKDKDLAVLEQMCERYAVMAYETLTRRLAVGLKSILYSYYDNPLEEMEGSFVAEFKPMRVGDCSETHNQIVNVKWTIKAYPNGRWRLLDGTVSVSNEAELYNILWTRTPDGTGMGLTKEKRFICSMGAENSQTFTNNISMTI